MKNIIACTMNKYDIGCKNTEIENPLHYITVCLYDALTEGDLTEASNYSQKQFLNTKSAKQMKADAKKGIERSTDYDAIMLNGIRCRI